MRGENGNTAPARVPDSLRRALAGYTIQMPGGSAANGSSSRVGGRA
jgi:hypothetical protein